MDKPNIFNPPTPMGESQGRDVVPVKINTGTNSVVASSLPESEQIPQEQVISDPNAFVPPEDVSNVLTQQEPPVSPVNPEGEQTQGQLVESPLEGQETPPEETLQLPPIQVPYDSSGYKVMQGGYAGSTYDPTLPIRLQLEEQQQGSNRETLFKNLSLRTVYRPNIETKDPYLDRVNEYVKEQENLVNRNKIGLHPDNVVPNMNGGVLNQNPLKVDVQTRGLTTELGRAIRDKYGITIDGFDYGNESIVNPFANVGNQVKALGRFLRIVPTIDPQEQAELDAQAEKYALEPWYSPKFIGGIIGSTFNTLKAGVLGEVTYTEDEIRGLHQLDSNGVWSPTKAQYGEYGTGVLGAGFYTLNLIPSTLSGLIYDVSDEIVRNVTGYDPYAGSRAWDAVVKGKDWTPTNRWSEEKYFGMFEPEGVQVGQRTGNWWFDLPDNIVDTLGGEGNAPIGYKGAHWLIQLPVALLAEGGLDDIADNALTGAQKKISNLLDKENVVLKVLDVPEEAIEKLNPVVKSIVIQVPDSDVTRIKIPSLPLLPESTVNTPNITVYRDIDEMNRVVTEADPLNYKPLSEIELNGYKITDPNTVSDVGMDLPLSKFEEHPRQVFHLDPLTGEVYKVDDLTGVLTIDPKPENFKVLTVTEKAQEAGTNLQKIELTGKEGIDTQVGNVLLDIPMKDIVLASSDSVTFFEMFGIKISDITKMGLNPETITLRQLTDFIAKQPNIYNPDGELNRLKLNTDLWSIQDVANVSGKTVEELTGVSNSTLVRVYNKTADDILYSDLPLITGKPAPKLLPYAGMRKVVKPEPESVPTDRILVTPYHLEGKPLKVETLDNGQLQVTVVSPEQATHYVKPSVVDDKGQEVLTIDNKVVEPTIKDTEDIVITDVTPAPAVAENVDPKELAKQGILSQIKKLEDRTNKKIIRMNQMELESSVIYYESSIAPLVRQYLGLKDDAPLTIPDIVKTIGEIGGRKPSSGGVVRRSYGTTKPANAASTEKPKTPAKAMSMDEYIAMKKQQAASTPKQETPRVTNTLKLEPVNPKDEPVQIKVKVEEPKPDSVVLEEVKVELAEAKKELVKAASEVTVKDVAQATSETITPAIPTPSVTAPSSAQLVIDKYGKRSPYEFVVDNYDNPSIKDDDYIALMDYWLEKGIITQDDYLDLLETRKEWRKKMNKKAAKTDSLSASKKKVKDAQRKSEQVQARLIEKDELFEQPVVQKELPKDMQNVSPAAKEAGDNYVRLHKMVQGTGNEVTKLQVELESIASKQRRTTKALEPVQELEKKDLATSKATKEFSKPAGEVEGKKPAAKTPRKANPNPKPASVRNNVKQVITLPKTTFSERTKTLQNTIYYHGTILNKSIPLNKTEPLDGGTPSEFGLGTYLTTDVNVSRAAATSGRWADSPQVESLNDVPHQRVVKLNTLTNFIDLDKKPVVAIREMFVNAMVANGVPSTIQAEWLKLVSPKTVPLKQYWNLFKEAYAKVNGSAISPELNLKFQQDVLLQFRQNKVQAGFSRIGGSRDNNFTMVVYDTTNLVEDISKPFDFIQKPADKAHIEKAESNQYLAQRSQVDHLPTDNTAKAVSLQAKKELTNMTIVEIANQYVAKQAELEQVATDLLESEKTLVKENIDMKRSVLSFMEETSPKQVAEDLGQKSQKAVLNTPCLPIPEVYKP